MINKNSKIFVAGHNGMVGSAVLRSLKKNKYKNVIIRQRIELDLLKRIILILLYVAQLLLVELRQTRLCKQISLLKI